MSEVRIFENPNFGSVRIIEDVESCQLLFCATDVCKALGYSNVSDAITKHVDTPDVAKRDTRVITGKRTDGTDAKRNISMSYVTESGLYSLIFGSKQERAKEFKRWVTSEVLPAIRKTGGYIASREDETDEDIMARALVVAQNTIKRKEERIKELEAMQHAKTSKQDPLAKKINKCVQAAKTLFGYVELEPAQKIEIANGILSKLGIERAANYKSAYAANYKLQGYATATELLAANKLDLSVQDFNFILQKIGFLEKRVSQSYKTAYMRIVGDGRKYGKNFARRKDQTDPRWKVSLFPELLKIVRKHL